MKQTLTLALALLALGCASCAGMSRGDRMRYGIDATRAMCKLAGVYPADVPQEIRPEIEPVCLALGAAKAEAEPVEDAGAE